MESTSGLSSPSAETVLARIAERIVPTKRERNEMNSLSEKLASKIDKTLREAGFKAKVSVQGSVARDTWLSGETDLDIFARFPPTMERREWVEKVLPAIHEGLGGYRMIERYAEHPFLEFHAGNVRVNVVPCYDVEKGQWKSATDRSPFHTEYMQERLTSELRLEARLLRKFMKGIRAYGAEIRVGGFSGMLAETLTLAYGSFVETLRQGSDWKTPIFIRLDSSEPSPGRFPEKFQSELVVIDPVDPERNLAAAVTSSKLWTFVGAAREFTRNPGEWYFYPARFKQKNKAQFSKKIKSSEFEIVAISFKHPRIVVDVLWGQLRKLERTLVDLMERNDFRVGRSETWSDEKNESIILIEVEDLDLPPVVRREGPPVSNGTGSEAFLQRHFLAEDTVNGPWISGNRWFVDKKRRNTNIHDLIRESTHGTPNTLVIPLELESGFYKSWKVHTGRQLLPLIHRPEFNQAFWEFLETKPSWLRPRTQ